MATQRFLNPMISRLFGRSSAKPARRRLAFRPDLGSPLESRRLFAWQIFNFGITDGTLSLLVDSSNGDGTGSLSLEMITVGPNYALRAAVVGGGPESVTIQPGAFSNITISRSGNLTNSLDVTTQGSFAISALSGPSSTLTSLNTLSLSIGPVGNLTLNQPFNISASNLTANVSGNVFVNANMAIDQPIRLASSDGNITFGGTATSFAVNGLAIDKSLNFNSTVGTTLTTGTGNHAFVFAPPGAIDFSLNGNISLAADSGALSSFQFNSGTTTLSLGAYSQGNISANFALPVNVSANTSAILSSDFTGDANTAGDLTIGSDFILTGDVNVSGSGGLFLNGGGVAGNLTLTGSGTLFQANETAIGITGEIVSAGNIVASGGLYSGNLTHSGGDATFNGTANLTGDVAVIAGLLTLDSSSLTANSVNLTGGCLSFSAGRIANDLTVDTSGDVTISGTANVSGNLIVTDADVTANETSVIAGDVNLVAGSVNITNASGIGGSLTVASGSDATGGFDVGGTALIAGNASVGDIAGAVNVTLGGNLTAGDLSDTALIAGTANVSDITGAVNVTSTGNLTAGNLSITALISGVADVGDITGAVNVTSTGNLTAGDLSDTALISGNATVGNITGAVNVTSTGNLTAANLGSSAYVEGTAVLGTVTGDLTVDGASATANAVSVNGDEARAKAGGELILTNGGNVDVFVEDGGSIAYLTGGTLTGDVSVSFYGNLEANGTVIITGNATAATGGTLSTFDNAEIQGNVNVVDDSVASLNSANAVGGNLTLINVAIATTTSDIDGVISVSDDAELNLNANNTNGTAPALAGNATLNIGANGSVASLSIGGANITVDITSNGTVRGGVVMTGGNLTTSGTGSIGGDVTVSSTNAASDANFASSGAIAGNLTVGGGSGTNVTVSSPIDGNLVTVTGGDLTLDGVTVNGTLVQSGGFTTLEDGSLVNGTTTVTGGTLTYQSAGTQNGTFTFTNAQVEAGSTSFTGSMTVNGATTVANGTMTLTDSTLSAADTANISANLVLNNTSGTVEGTANLSGAVTVGDQSSLTVNSTIAPTSLTIDNGGTVAINADSFVGTGGLTSNGTLNIGVVALAVDGDVFFGSGSDLLINYNQGTAVTGSNSNASYVNVTNGSALVTQNGSIELADLQQQTDAALANITFLESANTTSGNITGNFTNNGAVTNDINLGIKVVQDANTLSLGDYTAATIFVDDLFASNGTQTFWQAGVETKALLGTNAFSNLTDALSTSFMTATSNLVIGSGTYTGDLDLTDTINQNANVVNLSVSLANLTGSNLTAAPAVVNLTGNLVLSPNNNLTFGLFNGTTATSDTITVGGNVTLDGTLNLRAGDVSITELPSNLSTVLTLIRNEGENAVSGGFDGITDGQNEIDVTEYDGTGSVGKVWFFQGLNGEGFTGAANSVGVVVAPDRIDNTLGEVIANNGTSSPIGTVLSTGNIVGLNVWSNISEALGATSLANGTLRIYGGDYANGDLNFAGSDGGASNLTVIAGQNFTSSATVNITGNVTFGGNTTFRAGASSDSTSTNLSASNLSYGGANNTISVNLPVSVALLNSFTFLEARDANITGQANNVALFDGTNSNISPLSFNGTPLVLGSANYTPVNVSGTADQSVFRLIRTANGTQTYGDVAADANLSGPVFGQTVDGFVYGITLFNNDNGGLNQAFSVVGSGSNLTILSDGDYTGDATVSRNFNLTNATGVTSANLTGNLTFVQNGTMAAWTLTGDWFAVQGNITVNGYGASNDIATFDPFALIADNDGGLNLIFGNGTFTNANLVHTFENAGTLTITGGSVGTTLSPGSSGTAISIGSNASDRSVELTNLTFSGGSSAGDVIKLSSNQPIGDAPDYLLSNVKVGNSANVTTLANVTGNVSSLTVVATNGDNTFTLVESGLFSSTEWADKGVLFTKSQLGNLSVYGLGGNDMFLLGNGTSDANFAGRASFYGGEGNDTLEIYTSASANASTASALDLFDGGSGLNTLRSVVVGDASNRGYAFDLSADRAGTVAFSVNGTAIGMDTGYANVTSLIGSDGDDLFEVSGLSVSSVARVGSIDGGNGDNTLRIDGASGLYTSTTFRRYFVDPQDPMTEINDGYMAVTDSFTQNSTSSSFAIESFVNLQVFRGGASYDTYSFIGNPGYVTSIDAGSGGGALDYSNYFDGANPSNFSISGVTVSLSRGFASLVNSESQTANGSIANITAVYGSSFNDSLYGGTGHDILYGSAGNDYIDGGLGNDIVIGDYGVDTVVSGTGFDLITGDVFDPYTNYPNLTIPFPIIMERIRSQIWDGIANTTAFDQAVESLRTGFNGNMTQRNTMTSLSTSAEYGSNAISIPVFIGQDTPTTATNVNYTFINDNSSDVVRMFGIGSPNSATYLLYSAGPTNTSLSDNITGSQLGIRRRNRTYIIQ